MKLARILGLLLLAGCKREERKLHDHPEGNLGLPVAHQSPAEGNAEAISRGQTLFNNYNCAGCHAVHGGGAIGPPLTSKKLYYGSEPDQIFDTIYKGRPRGMPAWGGRIPESQIWQLVAFVRSLSGSEPPNATPGRSDTMETKTKAQLK